MRYLIVAGIVVVVHSVLPVAAQPAAPNGAELYAQHCATCHDGDMPTVLLPTPIDQLPADRIYETITYYFMQRHAADLTRAERRAVSEHVAGAGPGTLTPAVDRIAADAYCAADVAPATDPTVGPAWNGWSPSPRNARFQSAEAAGLTPDEVPTLALQWAFGLPGSVTASLQATVVGGRVLFGTSLGLVFSLDADSGCIDWVHETDFGIRAAIVVGPAEDGAFNVYVGDTDANVYALDFASGERRWQVEVDDHADARLTGAPALHAGRLYVPVASLEEGTAIWPAYECCTFRGSVVALDALTGDPIWKTYMIDDEARPTGTNDAGVGTRGPSGVGIWATPTLDPARNQLYVATGDSYSHPVADTSDAIVALAMNTGEIRWVSQTTPGDAWNAACLAQDASDRIGCPEDAGPDHDFGSAVVLVDSGTSPSVLLAGQKSGVLYRMDPATGDVQWETRLGDGGVLGGIEWGIASDGDVVYASISEAFEKAPGDAGGVAAVQVADGTIIWDAPPFQDTCGTRTGCHSAQPGAVTAIPGILFSGSLDGHIRAHDTVSGQVIWDYDTARTYDAINGVAAQGGSLNGPGPTIAGGTLYVSSGYATLGFMPGNVLLAFAVGDE